MASEAAQAAPTESDAPTQTAVSNTTGTPNNHLNQQMSNTNQFMFTPTKAVKTLARYLDMCLIRQQEIRRAVLYSNYYSQQCFEPNNYKELAKTTYSTTNLNNELNQKHFNTYTTEFHQMNRSIDTTEHGPYSTSHSSLHHKSSRCLRIICCEDLFNWCEKKMCQCNPLTKTKLIRKNRYNMQRLNYYNSNKDKKLSTSTSVDLITTGQLNANIPKSNQHSLIDLSHTMTDCTIEDQGLNCGVCVCCIKSNKPYVRHKKLPCCRYQGNFLVRLYLFIKLLYLFNAIGQIVLLEVYTGVEYNFYGVRVLYDLLCGKQWEESGHFPRVTFCDFEARKLAQSH